MHRLVTLPDTPAVLALLRRLEDAGIEATLMREPSAWDHYSGSMPRVSIWVHDGGQVADAEALVALVREDRVHASCPACGYDLSGHAGPMSCPECGEAVVAAEADVPCPACGEAVPGDFDLCWNCGEAILGEFDDEPADHGDDPDRA